jgi:acetyl-CoA acetyltransferase
MKRDRYVDWASIDDVVLGWANQAGEDNRNVARVGDDGDGQLQRTRAFRAVHDLRGARIAMILERV